jgi:hypothetical protein
MAVVSALTIIGTGNGLAAGDRKSAGEIESAIIILHPLEQGFFTRNPFTLASSSRRTKWQRTQRTEVNQAYPNRPHQAGRLCSNGAISR